MAAKSNNSREPHSNGDGRVDRSARIDQASPDAATFGRSGMDDAPPPLPKRWLILSGLLATGVIATTVIVGTGTFSLDVNSDADVPEATESLVDRDSARADADRREPGGISALTQATGSCFGAARSERNADSTGGLGIPPADADLAVVYQHQSAERALVAVTDGGVSAMCVSSPEGLFIATYDAGELPDPLRPYLSGPTLAGETVSGVVAGEVADDVERVEILIDGSPIDEADVAGGYFAAFLNPQQGDDVTFRVTSAEGRTDTVTASDSTTAPATRNRAAARACLNYLNITVAEPEPNGNRSEGAFNSAYDLLAEHKQRSYVLAAATDGTTITACVEAPGITWVATHADEVPTDELIAPLQPLTQAQDTDRYPVVGRVAESVTAVEVHMADGQRIDAHVQDGFYAALVPGDSPKTSYVVETDDGERITIPAN